MMLPYPFANTSMLPRHQAFGAMSLSTNLLSLAHQSY
jgi:hypothetical protein